MQYKYIYNWHFSWFQMLAVHYWIVLFMKETCINILTLGQKHWPSFLMAFSHCGITQHGTARLALLWLGLLFHYSLVPLQNWWDYRLIVIVRQSFKKRHANKWCCSGRCWLFRYSGFSRVANPMLPVVTILSDQSVICSVYTSHFSIVRARLEPQLRRYQKKYQILYTGQNPPKVSRTEPNHAVPCSGKAVLIQFKYQFRFICIALFMMQIVAKQLYRKFKLLHYIVIAYSVVPNWCPYGRNVQ